ncbi:hypothetical protein EMCRGX_G012936 [Ephydatia muelleri]
MHVVEKGTKKKEGSAPSLQSGVYVFPNGDRYEGDFIVTEGRIERSGTGTQHFVDGLVYTGQWKNDKMNGKGEVKYTTKATYVGDFVDNECHGMGIYTWPDGSKYTGPFVHNKLLGTGEFTDTSIRVWCGLFTGKVADGLRLKIS